jgi:U5 small nuclear ribonucleoprotein component
LEKGIAEHVEKELINVNNTKEVKSFLQSKYDWDILAASNVWTFGPETYGTNVLLNDSLATDTNQSNLNRVKQSIAQGFRWSTREGPLCDEPMRNVKFRVIEASLSDSPAECAPGQMIPTARRAFYSAFLTANPRMMEPVYYT